VIEVGRILRSLCGVGVVAMANAGLDTTHLVESVCELPLGAGVLQLHVMGVAVEVYIVRRCVAERVKMTH